MLYVSHFFRTGGNVLDYFIAECNFLESLPVAWKPHSDDETQC